MKTIRKKISISTVTFFILNEQKELTQMKFTCEGEKLNHSSARRTLIHNGYPSELIIDKIEIKEMIAVVPFDKFLTNAELIPSN